MKTRTRSLLIVVPVLAAGVTIWMWTRASAVRDFTASAVPADFVTLRHMSEDLVIRSPSQWTYLPQQFRRQNDVLVGLYPPESVWTDENSTRLFLHGHVLPAGVTFDQF